MIAGIDEAGRGPVLGPLVFCICYSSKVLSGFKDSKQLDAQKREKLKQLIDDDPEINYEVRVVQAEELSQRMLGKKRESVNEISHQAGQELIQRVLQKTCLKEVILDTVGPPEYYKKRLQSTFQGIEFKVEEKADRNHQIVSAASIVAKVTRDSYIDEQTKGCGYPSDNLTIEYMTKQYNNVFGFLPEIRFSWETAKNCIDQKGDFAWGKWIGENVEEDQPMIDALLRLNKNRFPWIQKKLFLCYDVNM